MKIIFKAYGWLSGIMLGFAAAYLSGILGAILPKPADLLCELSVGYCPAPHVLEFSATEIDNISDTLNVANAVAPEQIGMIHNDISSGNIPQPNMIRYSFDSEISGPFMFSVRYASAGGRAVEVKVNDNRIVGNYLADSTGGWNNQHRAWSPPIRVELVSGTNTVQLSSPSVFPHLSKIRFVQSF